MPPTVSGAAGGWPGATGNGLRDLPGAAVHSVHRARRSVWVPGAAVAWPRLFYFLPTGSGWQVEAVKLILFDVDGTLLLTGGAGSRAMTRAFEEVFLVRNAFEGIAMAGRTDPLIVADAVGRASLQPVAAQVSKFR